MEFHTQTLAQAAQLLLSAAQLGASWEEPLSALSRAVGAEGAVVVSSWHDQLQAIIASPSIAQPVAAYVQGQAPPDPRRQRIQLAAGTGFVGDLVHFSESELKRDPFYQEFLRPAKLGWHACALLAEDGPANSYVSFKRAYAAGPYQREQTDAMNRILPILRASFATAQAMAIGSAAHGIFNHLHGTTFVYKLDQSGNVLGQVGTPEPSPLDPVQIRRKRLYLPDIVESDRFDRALVGALPPQRHAASLFLHRNNGYGRLIAQFVPIVGSARDVFAPASLLVLINPLFQPGQPHPRLAPVLTELFQLTQAESRVAAMVAHGWSLRQVASELAITIGTVRNHLKAVMRKSGISRQVELVEIANRLWL